MPIKGLTERRQLPRIGKIRLGIKKVSPRTQREYPVATDYFVCPPEVQEVYGKQPKALDVIIPVEDEELWASQYYRQYSRTRGLICKGDGEVCRRMIDTQTGTIAGRETTTADWREGVVCAGKDCQDYQAKACQEVMNLQFILPKVPGLGVWQIDTGSIHSIMNINNCATMIRASVPTGRVSWVPLKLTLEPTEVVNPDDPEKRKKTVYCMHLRYDGKLENLLLDSGKPRLELIIGRPADDEAPDDRLLSTKTPEKAEEVIGKAEADIIDLWGEETKAPTSTLADRGSEGIDEPAGGNPPESQGSQSETDTKLTDLLLQVKEGMEQTRFKLPTLKSWLRSKVNYAELDTSGELEDIIKRMNQEQRQFLLKELQDRLAMR